MSEKYVSLASFKYGLDGRRDVLSSVPGTLQRLINAHINAGGEIEQRMSYVKDANAYPANTFGLQDTDAGLLTFGSDNAPSGPLPAGVTYVQLNFPISFLVAPGQEPTIDKIVFSCNFLGKAFVIAHWKNPVTQADFGTFFYYNGAPVGASSNGLFEGGAVSTLATNLANEVNAITGWSAVANVDQFGNPLNGSVIITTPQGIQSAFVPSVSSVAGLLGVQPIDQGSTGTPGIAAHASFQIVSGAGGDTIAVHAPFTAQGTGTAVLAAPVAWAGSPTATAAALVAVINSNTPLFGYTAVANAGNVTVYAPTSFGNFTFNLSVITTGTIVVGAAGTTSKFAIQVAPTPLTVTKTVGLSTPFAIVSGSVTVSYSGNGGAVTFTWAETDANGNVLPAGTTSGIVMSTTTGASCGFSKQLSQPPNQIAFGHFKVSVHDAGTGITLSQVFYVQLVLVYNKSAI